MSKLYKCAKGCGSVEETDKDESPVCCGVKMTEINEDEIFGCGGGCCHCCGSCGPEEEVAAEAAPEKK